MSSRTWFGISILGLEKLGSKAPPLWAGVFTTGIFSETVLRPLGYLAEKVLRGFDEINLGLDRASAVRSAERCFQCGLCNSCRNCDLFCPDLAVLMKGKGPEIDYDHCKGCGICVQECPRGALTLADEA